MKKEVGGRRAKDRATWVFALAGAVGSRRGWHAIVLSFLGLMTIAWPMLVTWVLLHVMVAV